MYACASSLAVLPVASPSASVVVPIPDVPGKQISLCAISRAGPQTQSPRGCFCPSRSLFPEAIVACCLLLAASTFLRPLPSTAPVLSTFHTSSITRLWSPSLGTAGSHIRPCYCQGALCLSRCGPGLGRVVSRTCPSRAYIRGCLDLRPRWGLMVRPEGGQVSGNKGILTACNLDGCRFR